MVKLKKVEIKTLMEKKAMSVIMVRMAMQHNELGCMTTILGFVSIMQR